MLQIWDSQVDQLLGDGWIKKFERPFSGFISVFDITNYKSYDNCKKHFFRMADTHQYQDKSRIFVGNKIDIDNTDRRSLSVVTGVYYENIFNGDNANYCIQT